MSKIYENNDHRLRGSKKKPKEPNPTADPVRSDHSLTCGKYGRERGANNNGTGEQAQA